jgi:hypothetical protein
MIWKVTLKQTSEKPQRNFTKTFIAEKEKCILLSDKADDFPFRRNRVLFWIDCLW